MTTILAKPVAVHTRTPITIATFGGKHCPLRSSLAYVRDHGRSIDFIVSPPSREDQPGFRKVETQPNTYNSSTDGILLTRGQVGIMESRDCSITTIMDNVRGESIMIHCGREAVAPYGYLTNPHHSIVTEALNVLEERGSLMRNLSAFVTAGICGRHFVHQLPEDEALLRPYLQTYPWAVDPKTGGLDLVGVVMTQLRNRGVPKSNIVHDGLCTFEDTAGLASKRRGDDSRHNNTVVVLA
jgi:copper oxidase (laccase) domain-containing protein